MAPKKRASSTPFPSETTTPMLDSGSRQVAIGDEWTDDQEALLFKQIIAMKPVGIHRHFRMAAITDELSTRYANLSHTDHFRPMNIWQKLSKLYNLRALNELEDNVALGVRSDGDFTLESSHDFHLPEDEFYDRTFARRLSSSRPSSPPFLSFQLNSASTSRSTRQGTIDDTDELRSSPIPQRRGKSRGRATGSVVGMASTRRNSTLTDLPKRGRRSTLNSVAHKRNVEDDSSTVVGGEDDVGSDEVEAGNQSMTLGSARRSGRRRGGG